MDEHSRIAELEAQLELERAGGVAVAQMESALAEKVKRLEHIVRRLMDSVGGCITKPDCGACNYCNARKELERTP